jgi:SNF2 family DNA or RNA helicase
VQYKGYGHVRLDGSTSITDRKLAIDRFNKNPESYFVFLLSTRYGFTDMIYHPRSITIGLN